MEYFVQTIWPIGMFCIWVIVILICIGYWLKETDMNIFFDDIMTILFIGIFMSFIWPALPLSIPGYFLWRLKKKIHPQLKIPSKDLRR